MYSCMLFLCPGNPLYDTGSNPALLAGNKNGPSLQPLPSITLSESYCLDVLRLKYDVEGMMY